MTDLEREELAEGQFFPLSGQRLVRIKTQTIRLRTTVVVVTIEAAYGQDPASGNWLSPMRQRWGLTARQERSPELEDRLCYTTAMADSFEAAAKLVWFWGFIPRRWSSGGVKSGPVAWRAFLL